jgi:hypothetical protein
MVPLQELIMMPQKPGMPSLSSITSQTSLNQCFKTAGNLNYVIFVLLEAATNKQAEEVAGDCLGDSAILDAIATRATSPYCLILSEHMMFFRFAP